VTAIGQSAGFSLAYICIELGRLHLMKIHDIRASTETATVWGNAALTDTSDGVYFTRSLGNPKRKV
jgi:hypothetical protein